MIASGGGAVVNIASHRSVVAGPNTVQYDTTKAAVAGLSRSMARDHAVDGIRVNSVSPGPTMTRFHEKRNRDMGMDVEAFEKTCGAAPPSPVLCHCSVCSADGASGLRAVLQRRRCCRGLRGRKRLRMRSCGSPRTTAASRPARKCSRSLCVFFRSLKEAAAPGTCWWTGARVRAATRASELDSERANADRQLHSAWLRRKGVGDKNVNRGAARTSQL